ncbi:MAG: gliding motility-associated C-terminal domain-containing protein, partial [Flavobacteriales bacterium]
QTHTYCGDTTFLYNAEGTFIPAIVITSQYGCVGSDSLTQTPIVMHGHPEVDFSWRPDPADVLNREVHFINETQGAEDVLWDFYSAGSSQQINPTWIFPDIETDTPYEVCLFATNEFGCSDTLCQDVTVDPVLEIFVPNAFTPDGDGINDVFLPIVQGVVSNTYKCWVFNRWGDPVFYTENRDQAWTGGNDQGEYYVQDAVYTWRIECVSLYDGEKRAFEGFVTLLR